MSNFKRITAVLLAVCMVFSVNIPVLAEAGEILGEALLFAPPKGQYSVVEYCLTDASGKAVENAVFTLISAPEGVLLDGNSLILDGGKIKNGTVKLSAASADGSVTADFSAEVQDRRLFFDMNGYEADSSPLNGPGNPTLLSTGAKDEKSNILKDDPTTPGSAYAVKNQESNNNGYIHATSGDKLRIQAQALGISPKTVKKFTMEMKVSYANDGKSNSSNNIFHGGWVIKYALGVSGFADYELMGVFNKDGAKISGDTNFEKLGKLLRQTSSGWTNLRMEFDWTNQIYDVYIDGDLICDDYKMPSDGTMERLFSANDDIAMCCRFDDVAFYTGTSAEAEADNRIPQVVKAGTHGAKLPFSGAMVGSAVIPSEITFDSSYVTYNNGYIEISPSAVGSTVTMTVKTDSFKKDIVFNVVSAAEDNSTASVNASTLEGLSAIKWTLRGRGATLSGCGADVTLNCADDADSDLSIYLDEWSNKYTAICDGRLICEGKYNDLSEISISNGEISAFYAGAIYEEAPIILDCALSDKAVIGKSLRADYKYFSLLYDEGTSAVEWYIDGVKQADGESFVITPDMAGKAIRAKVSISGGGYNLTAVTAEEEIKDLYSVEKTADGVKVTVNGTGEELSFITVVSWIKSGKTVKTVAKTTTSSALNIIENFVAGIDFDGARVCLLNTNLTPMAIEKFAGIPPVTHPSSGKNAPYMGVDGGRLCLYENGGGMTALILFKPLTENDFINYNNTLTSSAAETDWTGKADYISVVNADASLDIASNVSGVHMARAIFSDNTAKEVVYTVGNDKLFTENILDTPTESDFVKILSHAAAIDEAAAKKIYAGYQKADKSHVANIMKAEGYSMAELETAVLLSAFLRDKENKAELVNNLKARGIDEKPAELLAKNNDFASSAALVSKDKTIAETLSIMLETAILEGVKSSVNYLETRAYLEGLGTYTISDSMADSFTGKAFANIAELKTAVNNYTPPKKGGGGSGSSGGSRGSTGVVAVPGDISENTSQSEAKESFTDVPAHHWAKNDIELLVKKGILSGRGNGTFAPDEIITRAEFLKLIASALPIKAVEMAAELDDVAEGDWYYSYVKLATSAGIAKGDGRSFRPNDAISREDAAVMLYRALNNLNIELAQGENSASDSAEISPYAIDSVNAMYAAGYINGMDGDRFMPKGNLTRAQAAAIIARIIR